MDARMSLSGMAFDPIFKITLRVSCGKRNNLARKLANLEPCA